MSNTGLIIIAESVFIAAGFAFFIWRIAIQLRSPSISAPEQTKVKHQLYMAITVSIIGIGLLIHSCVLVNKTHSVATPRMEVPAPLPLITTDSCQKLPPLIKDEVADKLHSD